MCAIMASPCAIRARVQAQTRTVTASPIYGSRARVARAVRRKAADVEHTATGSEGSEGSGKKVVILPDKSIATAPDAERAFSFTEFANWLIPGHLMLGRYPFVEPSRCTSREQGEQHIRQLIQAGITTFVCLQSEIPPQSQMPIRGVEGFLPYKPTVLLEASVFYGPPPQEEIQRLRNRDLDKFLPPRRRAKAYVDTRPEMQFEHFPIEDLSVPSFEGLERTVDKVIEKLNAGEKVYLHCWGGRGRAGMVGACVLAKVYGLSAEDALAWVQRAFDTRQDGGRKSPETGGQFELVEQYIASLK